MSKQLMNSKGVAIAIPPGVSANLYRTKLCNFYIDKKECMYHEKCFFAHGEKELRPFVSDYHSFLQISL
jgi:hypothetical protein